MTAFDRVSLAYLFGALLILAAIAIASQVLAWRRANRPLAIEAAPHRLAIGSHTELHHAAGYGVGASPEAVMVAADAAGLVNAPYGATTAAGEVVEADERDYLAAAARPCAKELAPDYEGLHRDDPTSADEWIGDLRRAGHTVTCAQTSIERAYHRQTNEEFERFDRMMHAMLDRMWITNRARITRWDADWRQWKIDHPTEAIAADLNETREWIEREKGAVTLEFERIMTAEALVDA
jgi:hypothetical protein